jgi:hypothetical protein
MQWDVSLKDPFSYTRIGIWILIIVLFVIVIYFIVKNIKQRQIEEASKPKPIDVNSIKNEYISKIDNLLDRINNKKITDRKAYNELSVIIREFIFKTTNIDVLKYTLADAKKLQKSELSELLNEYYEPEFSKEGKGNIVNSVEKTRKVIMEWK